VEFAAPEGRLEIIDDSGQAADTLNARVLPILIAAGVGILEVRRGAGLEQVYFQSVARSAPPPPLPPMLAR
jgi:hypothetical protein